MSELAIGNSDYGSWLVHVKSEIRAAQVRAAVSVNVEMLQLYWGIGRDISRMQLDARYGSSFFETLSRDLRAEFPDVRGFSVTNLKYMKKFYTFYAGEIRHQAGDDLERVVLCNGW